MEKNPTKKSWLPPEVDVETLSQGFKDPLDHDFQSPRAHQARLTV